MKSLRRALHSMTTRVPLPVMIAFMVLIVIVQLLLLQLNGYATRTGKKELASAVSSEESRLVDDIQKMVARAEEAARRARLSEEAMVKTMERLKAAPGGQSAQAGQPAQEGKPAPGAQPVQGQSAHGGQSPQGQSAQAGQSPQGQSAQAGQSPQGQSAKGEQSAKQGQVPAQPDVAESISESEVDALTQVLQQRLTEAKEKKDVMTSFRNCSTLTASGNFRGTCVDPSCARQFPASLKTRVRQLLEPRFRLTKQQKDSIKQIGINVPKKKYIFVTAASSNHYQESQALIYNLRQTVFQKLPPDSYSFYYYDLGLKQQERKRVEKNCNCTVKAFNTSILPKEVRHLMCYSWKPLILHEMLPKAEVVVYMDVSVRFRPEMDVDRFFETVRHRGAQFLTNMDTIPNHTVQGMFDFYGDLPCQFWPYSEMLAGFTVIHNEPFVQRLMLEPWAACAFHPQCMCSVDVHAARICPHKQRKVGQCHRFDLSSMTLMMAKLFGPAVRYLAMQDNHPPVIRRNEVMDFFTD